MRKVKLMAMVATLVAGTAILLAGCNQQQSEEPPKPIQPSISVASGSEFSGHFWLQVGYNEDAQVKQIELYVDDVLVGKREVVAESEVAPQSLYASFRINSAACTVEYVNQQGTGCSASDNTPLFVNGKHTIRAVLKNDTETKSESVDVYFNNRDRVAFDLQGKSAVDDDGYTWYGGDDLTLNMVPVSYSGKTVSKIKVWAYRYTISDAFIYRSPVALDLGAGYGNSVDVAPSNGLASVTIAADDNNDPNHPVSGGMKFGAMIQYDDGTWAPGTTYSQAYAIDFYGPLAEEYRIKVNGLYDSTLLSAANSTGNWVNGNSPLYYKALDKASLWWIPPNFHSGVGGVTYKLEVVNASGDVVATLNPNDTLAGVAEAPTGSYDIRAVELSDALGNKAADPPSAFGGATLGLDKTAPVIDTDFDAAGKALNGTLGADSTIDGALNEAGGSGVGASANDIAAAPTSSTAIGNSGWLIEVTYGGCTYTLSAAGNLTNLPTASGAYVFDLAGTSAATPASCDPATDIYPTISTSSGDGDYTVKIRAIDNALNISDPLTVSFYWLTSKPTLTFQSPLPASVTLGGSAYFDADASIGVSSAKPIYKAVLYAYNTAGADADDVQVINPAPSADIANSAQLTWNADGSITGNLKDFTSQAGSFAFTARFNTAGTWEVVASAVPEAYDKNGAINVSNLNNETSQTVTVQ